MILYDDEHLRLIHLPGAGDFVLATFNELQMVADGEQFWGRTVAEKLQIETLGFISKRPNWFPASSMRAAARAAGPVLSRAREVVAYGHSMGGYGAIKYAGLVRATTVIGVCPQFSIDPSDVEDRRYTKYFNAAVHRGMRVAPDDASCPVYIFYDRGQTHDREQTDKILAAVATSTVIPVPFTGHNSVRVFANTSMARSLFALCRQRDTSGLHQLSRAARRPHQVRRMTLVERMDGRRTALAASLVLQNAPKLPASWDDLACMVVVRMMRNGDMADAQALLGRLKTIYPDDPALRRLESDMDLVARKVGLTKDSGISLWSDTGRTLPDNPEPGRFVFHLAKVPKTLAIRSRNTVPSNLPKSRSSDRRVLGVPIKRIVLRSRTAELALLHGNPCFRQGFLPPERQQRWTDGNGVIPQDLLRCLGDGAVVVDIECSVMGLRYFDQEVA